MQQMNLKMCMPSTHLHMYKALATVSQDAVAQAFYSSSACLAQASGALCQDLIRPEQVTLVPSDEPFPIKLLRQCLCITQQQCHQ